MTDDGVGPVPNLDGESLCSSNSFPGHTISFINWPLLTSSISPPWLLPCGQRMDFLSPVSPNPHSLLNTKLSMLPKADALTGFILKFTSALLPGSWTKATLKFWRSFRYLTLKPIHGLCQPPAWLRPSFSPVAEVDGTEWLTTSLRLCARRRGALGNAERGGNKRV